MTTTPLQIKELDNLVEEVEMDIMEIALMDPDYPWYLEDDELDQWIAKRCAEILDSLIAKLRK